MAHYCNGKQGLYGSKPLQQSDSWHSYLVSNLSKCGIEIYPQIKTIFNVGMELTILVG